MKVVVALDSLKGCLAAPEACQAVAEGILTVRPDAEVVQLPLSDGGEGLTDVLSRHLPGQSVSVKVLGPLAKPIEVRYHFSPHTLTAVMEMASACGLPLVPEALRNPLHTTTFGLGQMMTDAMRRGARHIIIGIGGSATNDAGIGMLQALGFRFFGQNNQPLPSPLTGASMDNVSIVAHQSQDCCSSISRLLLINSKTVEQGVFSKGEKPYYNGHEISLTVACDVQNPLFGPNGAAFVFAPQKGADANMVKQLDEGLRHFARISADFLGKDLSQTPGAGAAGGLGFALKAYLGATLKPGIDLVMDALRFSEQVKDADLVITGEGKSDRQTLMGKVPAGVLKAAKTHRVPVVLMAGRIEDEAALREAGFSHLININAGKNLSLEEAMRPEIAYQHLKEQAINLF